MRDSVKIVGTVAVIALLAAVLCTLAVRMLDEASHIGTPHHLDGPLPGPRIAEGSQPQSESKHDGGKPAADDRAAQQSAATAGDERSQNARYSAADEQQEEDEKSSADWWMVKLTAVIALATIFQFCGVVGQIFVYVGQSRSIRRQADGLEAASEIARVSAAAAKQAADAAALGLKIAERSIEEQRLLVEAQVRCYLHIVDASMKLTADGCPAVRFTVKNTGQSTAINFVWLTSVGYLVVPSNDGMPIFRSSPPVRPDLASYGVDIAAGDPFTGKDRTYFPVKPVEMEAFLALSGLMFDRSICAVWKDLFGKEFRATRNFKAFVQNGRPEVFYPLKYITGRLDGPTDPKPQGDREESSATFTVGQSAP